MPTVLDRLPRGARVAVIRLRSLGDCVLTTPAIHILKIFRPDLQISVVVEPRFASLFEDNADAAILNPSLRAIRGFKPDLCLNLHGGGRSARLTALSGAKHRAGFQHFPHRAIYNLHIPRAQEILGAERPVHTAEHLASAMFFLGVPLCEVPGAKLFANSRPAECSKPYAVIHPFASEPAKTWPARFFLEVASHIKRGFGLEPIFICGPGEDPSPFQVWRTVANAPLSRAKDLLANAALFVGNDSGPAHVAAAFGVPVVALFGPSDPLAWAPWQTDSTVLTSNGPLHNIAPVEVFRALEDLRVHA